MGSFRHHLDTIGIDETRSFECVTPPGGTLDESRADWFGDTPVEVIDDGLLDGGSGVLRVFLFEAMADDPLCVNAFFERNGVVLETDCEGTGARMKEWCCANVTAFEWGTVERTCLPGLLPEKVRSASNSTLSGNAMQAPGSRALRLLSRLKLPCPVRSSVAIEL
jgi:hypothetical protein